MQQHVTGTKQLRRLGVDAIDAVDVVVVYVYDVDVVVCTSLVDSINLDILKGSE